MNNQVTTAEQLATTPWILFEVLGAAMCIEERADTALAKVGLSLPKLGVLWVLSSADQPLALSELARCNKCVRSNMTQLVDRLEADGLVRRVNDPDDRRIRRAALTAAGRQAYAEGQRIVATQEREINNSLSVSDKLTLFRVLSGLSS